MYSIYKTVRKHYCVRVNSFINCKEPPLLHTHTHTFHRSTGSVSAQWFFPLCLIWEHLILCQMSVERGCRERGSATEWALQGFLRYMLIGRETSKKMFWEESRDWAEIQKKVLIKAQHTSRIFSLLGHVYVETPGVMKKNKKNPTPPVAYIVDLCVTNLKPRDRKVF